MTAVAQTGAYALNEALRREHGATEARVCPATLAALIAMRRRRRRRDGRLALRPGGAPFSASVCSTSSRFSRSRCSGAEYALPVSVASILVFDWLFLPPAAHIRLRDSENWVALAVYLVTAVVVSAPPARARRGRRRRNSGSGRRRSSAGVGVRCSGASTCSAS